MVSLNADTGQLLPRYGVVYGSDINTQDSDFEVARFRGRNPNFPQYVNKSAMFLRNKLYRSVLLFNTEDEARKAQPEIEKYLNDIDRHTTAINNPNWARGSYIVNLERWCPNWNTQQVNLNQGKIKYYNCKS